MLQRVRQQQQQQQQTQYSQQPSYGVLHSSPLNPTTSGLTYGSTPTKVSTASPFQSSSHHKQLPSPSYSPAGAGVGPLGTGTRTAAAPRQNSPVQLVRSWGTLIWSAEYALKFLRKVLASLPNENGSKRSRSGVGSTDVAAGGRQHRHRHHHGSSSTRPSQHVHHLRGPFIKIECLSAPSNYRPVYKEFKRWPVLLRNGKDFAGKKSPFADVNEPTPTPERKQLDERAAGGKGTGLETVVTQATVEGTSTNRMTRKLSSTISNATAARTGSTTTGKNAETVVKKRPQEKPAAAPPRDCGYCEICRIEYDSLAVHVQSESHQAFVQNDDNFVSLDRLLDSFGGGGGGEGGDDTRLADGYDTEEGAVAVEAFFQQLQNATRVKRVADEEPFERRRVSAHQPKALAKGKQERKERQEEKEQKGQQRTTTSTTTTTTTVTVAVTTTTTAAADELIERQKTPIGDRTIKEEAVAEVKQEQPQTQPTAHEEESNATKDGNEQRLLKCKQKSKRAQVKRKFDGDHSEREQCERLDSALRQRSTAHGSDGDGDKQDSSDCGNTTQELIKLALKSVIASFDCSDSEFLEDVERTLDDSVRLDESGLQCTGDSVKEQQLDKCSHNSKLGESDSNKRAANSSSNNNLTNRDSDSKQQQQGQRTTRTRACKRQTDVVCAVSRGERRSSRVVLPAAAAVPVSSTLEHLTEASSEGMFGRRSAIHHHPHNQLNHHNHQKHKSTLSALLLKQQQERDQQQHLLDLQEQNRVPKSAGSGPEWEEHEATDSGTVDHAAGMKVLTEFRKQRADDELNPDKTVLLVEPVARSAVIAAPIDVTVANEKLGILESSAVIKPTTVVGNRRKRNPRPAQQEDAMGLKASTIAMNNKHHHHHTHVAHLTDGVGATGGAVGTKTRHATELAATLLECDGLDPKNTKRISLGLRQNPKRANLNEDFTSLLDETLERSKTSNNSASTKRAAQPRVRGPAKGKEQTVTKQQSSKVNDEKPNRGCDEVEEKEQTHETLEHDRLTGVTAGVATSTKRTTGTMVSKKAAALEDIKVRGIRWRAPSPTTRPPVKSPLLYKVIDHQAGEEPISTCEELNERLTTSSSRSATMGPGSHTSRKESSTAVGVGTNTQSASNQPRSSKSSTTGKPSGSSPGKKNGLIVKIRRVRQSELSLLNDEAENFMFPRKDDSSSDEDTDDDRQTSSEGFHAAGGNNFSIDLASSSEGDRGVTAIKKEADRHSEAEQQHVSLSEEKQQQTAGSTGGGSRKRKKATAATATRAASPLGSDHLSSPTTQTSPLKSDDSASVGPVLKRARLEPSGRRKGQKHTADYEKGQDPAGSRMRFPAAPIQPSTTVAVTKVLPVSSNDRLRRRRSQSSASEDKGHEEKHADEAAEAKASDDDEEDVEAEKKEEHKGKRRKGGVRGRRVQRKPDRDEDAVVTSSTAVPLPTILCISCVARSYRGRGRGRGGVAGRRGRRGGVGRGGRRANRLQPGSSSCTCHLLDASRMPPPSSRRRNNESVERAGTPVSQRSTGTRASKTKTTPPNAAAPSSSSALAAAASSIMGSNSMCGSYIKGKEDGMGAVFKWINFRKRCEEIEPYRFAFERVPSLEPWYETFQRQDDGTEKVYEYFGSTGYRKLPYEMGPLPALGQNCCILNYKVIASRKSNRTASLQSSSSVSMEPASPSGSKSKPGSRLSTSEVQNITSSGSGSNSASAVNEPDGKKSSPSSSLSSLPLKKRKLLLQDGAGHSGSSVKADGTTGIIEGTSHSSRIARLIAGGSERPRKSPREHASTLAILSLLQQQQHRKRAGTIKILTSPKKATTATATQTTTLHEQLLHQDADSNGEELSRSCSRASERGSSRAGSSTGGIKFDRPLFPDSSYVNSRTLCLELDAFLSDELKRIAGEGAPSTLDGIVKKELSECIEAEDERELLADGTLVQSKPDCPTHDHPAGEMFELDQELLPPASVVQEGIAIERNGLSVSKRDLLDVLQTVGTEPPLSLKLVQRCETVVKKIVQYDRKERSMLASGTGSGLAISSASPVIGLQLFDSGSSLATCGPGSGVGSVGGSFLKKRINRTGWPTNKRKIGTRTRQQSRFMLPAAKKSLSRESVKKEEPEEGVEEEEIKDEIDDVSRQCVLKSHDDDEDTDVEDDDEAEDGEAGEEEEEDGGEVVVAGRDEPEDDEDDADTIVEQKVEVNPARCMPRKDVAQATINEKTDCIRRKQPDSKQEKQGSMANRAGLRKLVERKRRKRSFGKQHETHKASVSKREHISKVSCKEQTDDGGEQKKEDLEAKDATNRLNAQESLHEQGCEKERHPIAYDSMPTLRAALMRDNSQLQRNMASSMLLPSSPSKSSFLNPSSSAELLERGSLRQSSAGLAPGSLNRGTVPHSTGREAPAVDCESLLCPASSPGSGTGPLLGANCCKYVTKTTTTMTRVDYDGGGNVTSSGLPPLKLKHSREDVSTNNEEEEQQHSHREDNRQKQSGATNRYRGATASSTLVGSATLTATHDSDDKECDSISSRSIFVSDDCDTTSSSTAINPPDDRPPSTGELPSVSTGHANHLHHTEPVVATNAHSSDVTSPSSLPSNPRLLSNARVRRKESSGNEESIPNEAESTHNNELPSEKYMLVDALTKSPRTPSERIRNKMVKNRRVAIRMELATVAKKKQDAAKTHDDVVPPSKRRKSSSLGPPLPPPTVMPLSPPLTTSTSSSSSSSYGADDKAPLSPVGVVTSVRRKTHTDDRIIGEELLQDEQSLQHSSSANSGKVIENSAGIVLTPSKIKTRSSTFGHSPPKRTYGGAKLSLKKLPFVSLIKTTFVPEGGTTDKACTLVNGTQSLCTKNANKSNRRRKSVDKKTGNKSSPSMKKALKKRQEPKQNVTMAKKKQIKPVTGGVGSKRNKKLSARSKQIGARKKLQKPVEDVVSSGHFNNNSGAITNDGLEHQEEEDPLGTANERENSVEQHHTDEELNHRQHHHHTTTRVHDLMEEHLIEEEEEEEELLKRNAVVEEEDEEDLDGVDEEEHYELLELMEVEEQAEEEEDEMGDVADEEEEEEDAHQAEEEEEEEEEAEEEEDALLTGEDEVAERQQRQQKRQDDEERKLIMADHDYSDQHVDPTLADAEFVEVEELEEDDLESDEEDDLDEEEEAEEEQTEEDEAEDEDDDDEDDVEGNPLTATHPCRVTVAPSALSFGKQQRLKLTFASSSGASSTLAIDSATSTTVAAGTSASTAAKTFPTANSSSPTKYSPRKLRKPRGRWYRER